MLKSEKGSKGSLPKLGGTRSTPVHGEFISVASLGTSLNLQGTAITRSNTSLAIMLTSAKRGFIEIETSLTSVNRAETSVWTVRRGTNTVAASERAALAVAGKGVLWATESFFIPQPAAPMVEVRPRGKGGPFEEANWKEGTFMPQTDFLPTRDTDLAAWASHFASTIALSPGTYGISGGASAELSSLAASFAAALLTMAEPLNRNRVSVQEKKTIRQNLVAAIRSAGRTIRGLASVNQEMLTTLGLRVPDKILTPAAAPASPPVLYLEKIDSLAHTIRLQDSAATTHRAKPADVAGALVFTYVGDNPPSEIQAWRFAGIASRPTFRVAHPASSIRQTAHIAALWFNRKGQLGPASNQLSATVAA